MDVIQTKQGLEVKNFYNWVDCPYRVCCPKKEEREKTLMMHRCSYNPSIFECETYQEFNRQLGVQKIKDLRCL